MTSEYKSRLMYCSHDELLWFFVVRASRSIGVLRLARLNYHSSFIPPNEL